MATNIKGVRVSDLYPRLYFRSTTSDISTGTSAQYLTTSVQATGVAIDSALSLGTERVGIGTDAPDELLHIESATNPSVLLEDTRNTVKLRIKATDDSIFFGSITNHPIRIDVNNSEKVRITTGGSVGIGTTGPDSKLDVLDASNPQLRLTHTDGSKYVTFQVDTNHDLLVKPSSTGQVKFQPTTDSTDFFQVYDANGGTPVLNVDSTNERVGIGTASPGTTLDVGGIISATDITLSDASNPYITISDTTTPCTLEMLASNTTASIGTTTNHHLYIKTNNSTVATFTNGGNLGLGATPVNRLDVEGGMVVGTAYSGTSGSPANGILSEGTIGIGTASPASQLTVSGSEGSSGIINLWSDDGDDNADKWRVESSVTGGFNIASYSTGAWVNLLQVTPSAVKLGTDLNMNGNTFIETSLRLTDADVAHGITNIAPTDVYGDFGPIHGTRGGLYINGLSDQESADARSLALRGVCNDTHTDTVPTVEIIGAKRSGATVQALADAEIVLEVANHTTSLMTVSGGGLVKGTDFFIQQSGYARLSASNVSILSNSALSNFFDTGATSFTSIDAEGALRGMIYFAPYDTELVKVTAIIGSVGSVSDMSVRVMVCDTAVTGDLDGALAFTVLSTLTEAGALTTDKAYYITNSPGLTIGAGKFIIVGVTISSGSNQYICTNLTLQMRSIV